MYKPAITDAKLIAPIKERWSPRAFQGEQDISPEALQGVFEAARWAPSCFNEQPWRFLVFGRQDEGRAAVEASLDEGNKWACQASHLLVGTAYQQFKLNQNPNRYHGYDTGAAVISMILQAQSEGMVAHQMGGFNQQALHESLLIPEDVSIMAVVALGHEDKEKSGLNEAQLEKEKAPRSRLTLDEVMTVGKQWTFSR